MVVLPVAVFLLPDDTLPDTDAGLCLVTVLLDAEMFSADFDAVTLLRDVVLPLSVPRLVLELVPMPLLTVVLPDSANTLPSGCVSCLGPYHLCLSKWPPCPCPGPP